MTTQVNSASNKKLLHVTNSGEASAGADSAARPRNANMSEFDVPPQAAAARGRGQAPEDTQHAAALDPRGGGRDPEDPRPGADAGAAPAGDDDDEGAPPADDAADHVHISRTSDAYHRMASLGQAKTYPADCYSFIAIHSPFVEPKFFAFGLMVFLFQMSFLVLMVFSIIWHRFRVGQVDNPHDTFVAKFIPSNVNVLANITQITAFLSYCIFSDSSLQDMVKAVEQFPRLDRARENDGMRQVILSCVLRFIQGLMATIVTVLLIITTADVVDIILNFAAVNYISNLDEAAFVLAKLGKYGPCLEKEAKSIEKRIVPYSLHRESNHKRHVYAVIPITLGMLVIFSLVTCMQLSPNYWLTKALRVQFRDPALHPYSGCYDLSPISHDRRKNYNGNASNEKQGIFGYCRKDQHWVLFRPEVDDEGDVITNPCNVSPENKLASSTKTDTFDIWSSSSGVWFTASGEPLDLYFTAERDALNCESFLYDGKCDQPFNDWKHQYDGGDCCASTCGKTNCGAGGVTSAFGKPGRQGNGYPNCEDPDMVAVTILLTSIRSSRNEKYESFLNVTNAEVEDYERDKGISSFWEEVPHPAYFIVDCDEDNSLSRLVDIKKINFLSVYVDDSMENQTEIIMVPDGARCQISVSNKTNSGDKWDNDAIWFVNYTVYHGDGRVNEIISGDSSKEQSTVFHRIPKCYFDKLKDFVNPESAYAFNDSKTKALGWLVEDNDKSGHSKCDDDFLIERAVLSAINFAAPIKTDTNETADTLWIDKQQQCGWKNIACDNGSVKTLAVTGSNLSGTISTSIGLLTGLQRIYFDYNALSGTIPSEIGNLINVTALDLDNNAFSGTIPTEFGHLKMMVELDLDHNKLTGTIPTEIGTMTNAREFDFKENQLSGSIPTEFGNLQNIKILELNDNTMTGALPTQIGKLTKLEQLYLGGNNLIGRLPTQLGKLTELEQLYLEDNDLTGRLPTHLGKLTKLVRLHLGGNNLTDSIPTEIGLMKSLSWIRLESNALSGVIPVETASLMNLTLLELTNNSMTGPLPTQLGELTKLEHLDLGNNDFTGSIPTEIGSMKSLSCINLSGNYLRGLIPSEIGLMTNLTEIQLEGNDFTGTIPVEVASLERLQILTFGGSLTGDIPGNIKTLVPCVLCSGTSYKSKNISDNSPYPPSASDCDTLLEEQQDTEKPFSSNDCEVLKEACIDCIVPDNLFAVFGPSP